MPLERWEDRVITLVARVFGERESTKALDSLYAADGWKNYPKLCKSLLLELDANERNMPTLYELGAVFNDAGKVRKGLELMLKIRLLTKLDNPDDNDYDSEWGKLFGESNADVLSYKYSSATVRKRWAVEG